MISIPKRGKYLPKPRYRHPEWLPKPQRVVCNIQIIYSYFNVIFKYKNMRTYIKIDKNTFVAI